MEKCNIAEETINLYLDIEDTWFNKSLDQANFLRKSINTLQRFIDDNNFVLDFYGYDGGVYVISFNYNNSDTHAVDVIINHDNILIKHYGYYGDLSITIYKDGIRGDLGTDQDTWFMFDDEQINDYTLKYDYIFQSEDEPGKMSELISYAKNYYPKAFKAKCAKQRERINSDKKERNFNRYE